MHIICPREELQKGVSIVSKAVSNKTTMPILECILIQTKEGRILMTERSVGQDEGEHRPSWHH